MKLTATQARFYNYLLKGYRIEYLSDGSWPCIVLNKKGSKVLERFQRRSYQVLQQQNLIVLSDSEPALISLKNLDKAAKVQLKKGVEDALGGSANIAKISAIASEFGLVVEQRQNPRKQLIFTGARDSKKIGFNIAYSVLTEFTVSKWRKLIEKSWQETELQ